MHLLKITHYTSSKHEIETEIFVTRIEDENMPRNTQIRDEIARRRLSEKCEKGG